MRVRQSEAFNRQFRGRLIALAIFASLLTILFLVPRVSSTAVEMEAQGRQRPRKTRPRPTAPTQTQARAGRNYSRFKHEDHRQPVAKLDCDNCHSIPSPATPDTIAAATKPSVEGYPYHDSCVRCHRQQFFKGASPPICTVCHTRATPRLTVRDMHPFPKQGEQQIAREFPGYFPHSLHQSVIARDVKPVQGADAEWTFVRASFNAADDPAAKALDNCATCHLTDDRQPMAIAVGGTEATFKPEAKGTFKTVPSGHASCFNCHWQSQKPVKDDCAGCHLSQSAYTKKKRAASIDAALPGVLSPNAAQWFKAWPREWPKRLSIKFNHETPTDHDIGCTACHINLTQMETLNIPKADVPIATCARCHITGSVGTKGGEKITIYTEMTKEEGDQDKKVNTCTGCHTSLIGRERPPCSHYLVLGKPCPQ
jgi:nitrate/TMAO reductase-like tetraheme cytochrome c subunit